MNDLELKALTRDMLGDPRFDMLVDPYVDVAKHTLANHVFPFVDKPKWEDVPEKYHFKVAEIACYMINKRGAEGEISHSESGITRIYESASVPKSMLADVVPFVGIP